MTQHNDVEATDWSVSLVAAAPSDMPGYDWAGLDDVILDLLNAFQVPDIVVGWSDGDLTVSFTVTADSPDIAVAQAVDLWTKVANDARVDSWLLVRAEAATYDELAKEFQATALPPLVGVAEVAELLGVSKQRVSALHQEDRLPRPLARLASGPVWAAAGIKQFTESRGRQPGVAAARQSSPAAARQQHR